MREYADMLTYTNRDSDASLPKVENASNNSSTRLTRLTPPYGNVIMLLCNS